MGPLMIDVESYDLSQEDKELIQHPLVGGVILFSRNCESPEQVSHLTQSIKNASSTPILVAVDHEGGRVQRFRDGFTAIPAMYDLWQTSGQSVDKAKQLAFSCGYLMALEVLAVGIDISFAPVLDINNISEVIGDRAFHQQPEGVVEIAREFINGMHRAGMSTTGKHFPGHGSVKEDSHFALPIDKREQQAIFQGDMVPFTRLIHENKLDALMPAHVIYSQIDADAVGFSKYWLQEILRKQLAFDGVIFSDDLSMHGAAYIGGFVERAEAAQQAGCDMLLVCNDRNASIEIIDNANLSIDKVSQVRLSRMLAKTEINWQQLKGQQGWQTHVDVIGKVHELVKN